MPRAPILSRDCFYQKLRDGTYRDLDWNLVNTSLGAMVEARSIGGYTGEQVLDLRDLSFNDRREFDENKFFRYHGTGGNQLPVDFAQ